MPTRTAISSPGNVDAFDIGHYDIDVIASPERRWIEGRTQMTVRVAALPIQTLCCGSPNRSWCNRW